MDYRPISCHDHDRLLDLATRRIPVWVRYLLQGQECRLQGLILDVYTRDGAEFLRMDQGEPIRLDALLEVDGRPFGQAGNCGVVTGD